MNVVSLSHTQAISFRDVALHEVFKAAINALKQVLAERTQQSMATQQKQELDDKGCLLALQLVEYCLGYDFIGTTHDESGEDLGTLQVPITWRNEFEDQSLLNLFFGMYQYGFAHHTAAAMGCLVLIVSIRRSLFSSDNTKMVFLQQLMNGICNILRTQHGFESQENFHEFCRLLARFKANYQLVEIVKIDCYAEWIRLVAAFTMQAFQVLYFYRW